MSNSVKPLDGVTVVNAALGLAPAIIGKFLSEFGARVLRVPPEGGDPFPQIYPAYSVLRGKEQLIDEAGFGDAVATADICILGGEDHPALPPARDAENLLAADPALVVLDIQGYPAWSDDAGRPATEVLVQARGGICHEHYTNRPNFVTFQPASYGAALQGLIGLIGALYERKVSGTGQIVSTSLYEGMLSWVTTWALAEKSTPAFEFFFPRDPTPIILPARDGVYIHITLGAKGAKARLYAALGIDEPGMHPDDAGLPRLEDGPELFFGDLKRLAPYIAQWDSAELLEKLWKADIVADAVLPPGACWDHPQVQANDILDRTADGVRHVGNPIKMQASPASQLAPPSLADTPLQGLRVVDFGAFVAGPLASVALRDLGADVIKVEPLSGDPMRAFFRPYASSNRGKRSLALDMKTAEGIEIARRLCMTADVVTSNFKPGVSKRLGIDAETLHAARPALIVLDAPGYGTSGPDRDRPAFDPIIQAFCGHELRGGGKGNAPLWSRTAMVDYTGGYLGSLATLLGLYHRLESGAGSLQIVPLLNAGVYLSSDVVQLADGQWLGGDFNDARQAGLHPAESFYETADGWIAIVVRSEKAANDLAKTLALPCLTAVPFRQWGEAERDSIVTTCRLHCSSNLLASLEQTAVWAEPCRLNMEWTTLSDPRSKAAGLVHDVLDSAYGPMARLGPLFRFSRSRMAPTKAAPGLGAQSREILQDLGYSAAEIDDLFARRIAA